MEMSFINTAAITVIAAAGAALLLYLLGTMRREPPARAMSACDKPSDPVFLFAGDKLLDATPEATALLGPLADRMSARDAVIQVLSPYFPDIRHALGTTTSRISCKHDDSMWIELERTRDTLRLSVKGRRFNLEGAGDEPVTRRIELAELAMLRDMARHSPQLAWQEDREGKLLWANRAYLALCDRMRSDTNETRSAWPDKPLFPDLHETQFTSAPSLRRVSVMLPGQEGESWFDVTSLERDDCCIHFGAEANAIVRADQERHNFIQTLGKTFAELSIGLAIFDKRRQLAMFNPALLEMTRLPFEFLSGRPTIDTVLDRLRESRILPEPRNYASWRDKFTAVENAAKEGSFCETWDLPDGQAYRVTGRPHPDGAFAFLFEDISAEVSLTRRFRSDIETSQAVLDTLPDAIAVFSGAGTLVMSNTAYTALWGGVSDESLLPDEIDSALASWQARSVPSHIWGDLLQFVRRLGPREPWSGNAVLKDGRHMRCTARSIPGGLTMIRFGQTRRHAPVLRKLAQSDPVLRAAKR